jgi:hypothetical protein
MADRTVRAFGVIATPLFGAEESVISAARPIVATADAKPTPTAEERKIAASFTSISAEEIAAQRARGTGLQIASHFLGAKAPQRRLDSPGLADAHREIDRARKETYESAEDGAGDQELLDSALAKLNSYDPELAETYDDLLLGVLYAARLLNRVAPAFADAKPIKQ